MPTITEIREAIAARLSEISGLTAYDHVPDSVDSPAAVVFGPEIEFDQAFMRGSDKMTFALVLIVSRNSPDDAQGLLDSFLAPSGATSVKTAVEGAGGDLGGIVADVRCTEVREYGEKTVGSFQGYGAAMIVEVLT